VIDMQFEQRTDEIVVFVKTVIRKPNFQGTLMNLCRAACELLCMATLSVAGNSLEPFLQKGFGSTLYRLEMAFPLTGTLDTIPDNTTGLGQSELEYPLDPWLAGIRYRHETASTGEPTLGFGLSCWTNISQPGDKMKDSDWFGARTSSGTTTATALFKYSQTQSRAEVAWYGAEMGADIGDFTLFSKPVRYGLNIRAERLDFLLYGVEGWQRKPSELPILIDDLANTRVLTYGLTRIMPRFFTDLRLSEGRKIAVNTRLSVAPTLAFDRDDHLLRRKVSETFAFGFEVAAAAEIRYQLSSRYWAVASSEVAYFRNKGKMDQHFYGDDPFTDDTNETGLEYNNIVTRIISLSGNFSAGIGYLF
jgi:hypothetical protein